MEETVLIVRCTTLALAAALVLGAAGTAFADDMASPKPDAMKGHTMMKSSSMKSDSMKGHSMMKGSMKSDSMKGHMMKSDSMKGSMKSDSMKGGAMKGDHMMASPSPKP